MYIPYMSAQRNEDNIEIVIKELNYREYSVIQLILFVCLLVYFKNVPIPFVFLIILN